MVEYLKTKIGYFYKLKKNGEKKRISKKEYNKKNKTRKNKKMIGGGRKEKEIIDELKDKGKYEEWVSLGSNFGLTRNIQNTIFSGFSVPDLNPDFFSVRPYKYYNVDGNIVNVSMVTKKYRPDVDNIAVFKQLVVKDPTHVDQSTYKIVDRGNNLSTAGLATCTGLAMLIGDKKFMAHLDATTDTTPIINAINKEIDKQNINPDSLTPFIYAGCLDSSLTLQKAKDIFLSVEIPEKNYKILNVNMFDRVHI